MERSQIIAVLKGMYLFASLDDAQLSRVLQLFQPEVKQADQIIIKEGDPSDKFYIILEGEVEVCRKVGAEVVQVDVLVAGDYFGEEGLLQSRPRTATVSAVGQVTLLAVDLGNFHQLMMDFPQVKVGLERIIDSRRLVRKFRFDWLNEEEVVYQVRRKHLAYLALILVAPVLVFFFTLLFMLFIAIGMSGLVRTALGALDGLFLLGSLLVGLWLYLDWSNDYYIVTNQRVVWIEKVIWLYDSRVEAPMNMITSVKTTTSLLGRILGYGDITISTYTGSMVLRIVNESYLVEAIIRELWQRAQISFNREAAEEARRSVMHILGTEPPAEPREKKVPARPESTSDVRELGFGRQYFGSIFKMRFEEGGTITYRKHWLMLVKKSWLPLLTGFMIIILFGSYGTVYLTDIFRPISLLPVSGLSIFLLVFVVFPWWLYNYVDWRNDIYQLTDKNLFDIERKPLGTEMRKAAPLEKILSLEHERPGFIGYVFNVGNVMVNAGDTKLTFNGVHEPARVQTDIFRRMEELRAGQQRAEVERERDRVLSLLTIYHEQDHARDVFQALLDTIPLWYSTLIWGMSLLATLRIGLRLGERLKMNLAWLKESQTEGVFRSVFSDAVKRYYLERGEKQVAQAAALTLTHVARYDATQLDRTAILYMVFALEPHSNPLADIVQRHSDAFWRTQTSQDEVISEMQTLVMDYLRQGFKTREEFASRPRFADMASALDDLLDAKARQRTV